MKNDTMLIQFGGGGGGGGGGEGGKRVSYERGGDAHRLA